MENKYKVGDKLYFGFFTGDDIVVEEYEVTNVYNSEIELCNTTNDIVIEEYKVTNVYNSEIELRNTTNDVLTVVRYSWLKDTNHFDTYEKAYHHTVNITGSNLLKDLTDAEKEVRILKEKIAKFNDKYGKKD